MPDNFFMFQLAQDDNTGWREAVKMTKVKKYFR